MWLRYRRNYGSGVWTKWHETRGTEDDSPIACGLTHVPVHRIESKERRPELGFCKICYKLTRKRRAAGQGCAKPQRRRG